MNTNFSYKSGDAPSVIEQKTSATSYNGENENFDIKPHGEYSRLASVEDQLDERIQEQVMKTIERESYKTILSAI